MINFIIQAGCGPQPSEYSLPCFKCIQSGLQQGLVEPLYNDHFENIKRSPPRKGFLMLVSFYSGDEECSRLLQYRLTNLIHQYIQKLPLYLTSLTVHQHLLAIDINGHLRSVQPTHHVIYHHRPSPFKTTLLLWSSCCPGAVIFLKLKLTDSAHNRGASFLFSESRCISSLSWMPHYLDWLLSILDWSSL